MKEDTLEQTFEVRPDARIKIENITGKIIFQPGQDGRVHIKAEKHGDAERIENTRVEINQDRNSNIKIKVRADGNGLFGIDKKGVCRVEFSIQTPANFRVYAATVDGRIDVEGITGQVACKGVSADMHLVDVNGEIRAKSVSGKISGERLGGEGDFDNVSGEIELHSSQFSDLACNSVSGNIDFTGAISRKGAEFGSISGNIRLVLGEDEELSIAGKTLSGMVAFPPGANLRKWGFGNFRGDINGGGTNIHLKTVSGDLTTSLGDERMPSGEKLGGPVLAGG